MNNLSGIPYLNNFQLKPIITSHRSKQILWTDFPQFFNTVVPTQKNQNIYSEKPVLFLKKHIFFEKLHFSIIG